MNTLLTPVSFEGFPWMEFALRELAFGVTESKGKNFNNLRILNYIKTTGAWNTRSDTGAFAYRKDETPWCSAFVNWCILESGINGTNSAMAKSWLEWGMEIEEPCYGCIAVYSRVGGSHVGFYTGSEGNKSLLLGGNQSDSVCLKRYPSKDQILEGYRWPQNFAFPR